MTMSQLMALVPMESARSVRAASRMTKWEKPVKSLGQATNTRFGSIEDKDYLPPPFIDLPAGMKWHEIDLFLREQRYDDLSQKLASGELEMGDPDIRPPSPPPQYDKNGARTNHRDTRVKNAMNAEYNRLIDFLLQKVEGFQPPPDWRPLKKIRRIEIPLDKYPEYNFMGLIIGPRGCNHKRLETESGTQISVRGRGTQKEGRKTDHQSEEEASLPMHVHIQADNDERLQKAVELIEPLLDPFHPMHENFKKRGLEQLALVNGFSISKLDQRCAVCGGTGHLAFECPDAPELQNFKKPQVKCAICGDEGHVTMDCKQAQGTSISQGRMMQTPYGVVPMGQYNEKQKMDNEYKKMMDELSGKPALMDDQSQQQKMLDPNLVHGMHGADPRAVHFYGAGRPHMRPPPEMFPYRHPAYARMDGVHSMPWMGYQQNGPQAQSWGPIAPPPQYQMPAQMPHPGMGYPNIPPQPFQQDSGEEDEMDTSC